MQRGKEVTAPHNLAPNVGPRTCAVLGVACCFQIYGVFCHKKLFACAQPVSDKKLSGREQNNSESTERFGSKPRALLAQIPDVLTEKVQLDMIYRFLNWRIESGYPVIASPPSMNCWNVMKLLKTLQNRPRSNLRAPKVLVSASVKRLVIKHHCDCVQCLNATVAVLQGSWARSSKNVDLQVQISRALNVLRLMSLKSVTLRMFLKVVQDQWYKLLLMLMMDDIHSLRSSVQPWVLRAITYSRR